MVLSSPVEKKSDRAWSFVSPPSSAFNSPRMANERRFPLDRVSTGNACPGFFIARMAAPRAGIFAFFSIR
jgi:hypothetical protein